MSKYGHLGLVSYYHNGLCTCMSGVQMGNVYTSIEHFHSSLDNLFEQEINKNDMYFHAYNQTENTHILQKTFFGGIYNKFFGWAKFFG